MSLTSAAVPQQSSQSSIITPATPQILPQTPETPSVVLSDGLIVEQTPDGEWSYDPNEPRYCICNQVSYGDMVACDNEDVIFILFLHLRKIHIIDLLSFSVLSSGFTIPASVLRSPPRENGIVHSVYLQCDVVAPARIEVSHVYYIKTK